LSTIDRELSQKELYDLDEIAAAFARQSQNGESLSPKEYKQWRAHRERLASLGSGSTFNGSPRFVNFMLSVIAGLLIAGIGGGILMYGDFKSVQAEVKSIHETIDLIITGRIRIPQ
jgi:hypothetical protein